MVLKEIPLKDQLIQGLGNVHGRWNQETMHVFLELLETCPLQQGKAKAFQGFAKHGQKLLELFHLGKSSGSLSDVQTKVQTKSKGWKNTLCCTGDTLNYYFAGLSTLLIW